MFDRTKAWLRGGAGIMRDRRLKRTGRGADEAAAIEESLAGVEEEPVEDPCVEAKRQAEAELSLLTGCEEDADADVLLCVVCRRVFTMLSGGVRGCPVHGIREGVRDVDADREEEARLAKVAAYRAGRYWFPPPPVCTALWDEDAWIRFIDKDGGWL